MLTCIFIDNLTLNFVKKPNARKNVRLKTISTKSLKKYMQLLTQALEEKISRLLPDKFGQVFDGWSNGGVRYIATFATFDRQPENKPILLAFSPMDDKQDLTAMSFMTFLLTPMTCTANHWKIFHSFSRIIVALIRLLANIPPCHSPGVLVTGSIWQFSSIWWNINSFWGKFTN